MKKHTFLISTVLFMMCLIFSSCSSGLKEHTGEPRDTTPQVLTPAASGTSVYGNDTVSIDASNITQGYVMVSYTGSSENVRLQITGPDGTCYTYLILEQNSYATFPLTAGNGDYSIKLLEGTSDDFYVVSLEQTVTVQLENEFLPFLYPNQYVNFTADSKAVAKGSELAKDTWSDLDVIQNIYNYVTETITYDDTKAQNVSYGYLPDIDETLTTKTGICFDYAALMTAMLRSQGIPARLEVGYAGDIYHAWISAYAKEQGWIDNIIEFNGDSWNLMDPTLAAGNDAGEVQKYTSDQTNYIVKYTY